MTKPDSDFEYTADLTWPRPQSSPTPRSRPTPSSTLSPSPNPTPNPTPIPSVNRGRVRASGFDPESVSESVPESQSDYAAEFGPGSTSTLTSTPMPSDSQHAITHSEYFTPRPATTRHAMSCYAPPHHIKPPHVILRHNNHTMPYSSNKRQCHDMSSR